MESCGSQIQSSISESSHTERKKKLTLGRRKIEMEKIQKKSSLQVAFSKRRRGLFKKASELCILCGSELSIIVQSPANKFYAFHSPSTESMLHRFDMGVVARTEYEEAVRMLEEKKKEAVGTTTTCEFWWDQQIEGMDLQELEEYLESLESLGKNVSSETEKRNRFKQ